MVNVHGKTSIHIIAKVNIQLSCSMITGKTVFCFYATNNDFTF